MKLSLGVLSGVVIVLLAAGAAVPAAYADGSPAPSSSAPTSPPPVAPVSTAPVRPTPPPPAGPVVLRLSVNRGSSWGGTVLTLAGSGFSHAYAVKFGNATVWNPTVLSDTRIRVSAPQHGAAVVYVQVVTAVGTSKALAGGRFTYVKTAPSYSMTPLNGGMTAAQEHAIGARLMPRAASVNAARAAANPGHWTAQMGASAVARAKAWVGTPYAWDGGRTSGPSNGACTNDTFSWFDCKVWGFDCSGLALYAWGKYRSMDHYAASQYSQAGRYHPSVAALVPGDLLFYSGNRTVAGIYHVAIYVGGGKMIEAPESGWTVHVTPARLSGSYFGATRPMSTGRQGAAPTVTGISAKSGSSSGGTTLIVTGSGFKDVASVRFGPMITYVVRVLSSSMLQVTVPAHASASVAVTVVDAWGSSTPTRNSTYTYVG